MLNFEFGTKYNFKTKAPFILGNKYENMLYMGTVDYNIANRLGINCQLMHRQVYHLLPNTTPDNARLYKYHLFLDTDNVLKILGDPWIDNNSVATGKKGNYTIVIKDILNDDVSLITDTIQDAGYKTFSVRKIKSTNGIHNSIYELISGKPPIGGGLDDGEGGTEIEDDGSAAIGKPIITCEAEGEFNPYVKFIFSEFVDALTTMITHYSTDMEVASDEEFENIVWEKHENIVDLTSLSHIPNLTNNNSYYIRIRYTSNVGSKSKWSNPYKFVYKEYYTAPSGRRYKRHDSGQASVMLWKDNNGVEHTALILDSKYRKKLRFIKSNVDLTISDDNVFDKHDFGLAISDEMLKTSPGYFEDSHSSKLNTELYNNQDANTQSAVGWILTQSISHDGALYQPSIPNIQLAIRIIADSVVIDKLDPTSTDTDCNLVVDSPYIWTSTKYKTEVETYANGVSSFTNYFWAIGTFVTSTYFNATNVITVAPVVELT